MQSQYSVLGYRIDLYFYDYKVAIEIDEFGHTDRNFDDENKRQKAIEKELGYKFIRINIDEKNYNFLKHINEIHRLVKQSSKASLIDRISKRLLEFKSNH